MEDNRLYGFMEEYEKREGQEEEGKLYDLLELALINEDNTSPKEYKKYNALERLKFLKNVLDSTDEDTINSNIYLRSCRDFLEESEENCADILISHQANRKNEVVQLIYNNSIPREVEEPELLHLPYVDTYNNMARDIKKMYEEINRLQLWNIIDKSDLNNIDVGKVSVTLVDDNTASIKTTFNTKRYSKNKTKKLDFDQK